MVKQAAEGTTTSTSHFFSFLGWSINTFFKRKLRKVYCVLPFLRTNKIVWCFAMKNEMVLTLSRVCWIACVVSFLVFFLSFTVWQGKPYNPLSSHFYLLDRWLSPCGAAVTLTWRKDLTELTSALSVGVVGDQWAHQLGTGKCICRNAKILLLPLNKIIPVDSNWQPHNQVLIVII